MLVVDDDSHALRQMRGALAAAGYALATAAGPGGMARLVGVPTRSVRKYTLRPRPESPGAHEAVEGGPGHAGELGDGGLRDAQLEEAADLVLLAVEP